MTTAFVTIQPAMQADGETPKRVPMPGGLGLPGVGSVLPADGARVPLTPFVARLIADGDVVVPGAPAPAPIEVEMPALPGQPAAAPASTANAASTASPAATTTISGSTGH